MTTEQRKISLINWITNLDDEAVISQIEDCRRASLSELPSEIIELLTASDAFDEEDCIEHTTSKNLVDGQ